MSKKHIFLSIFSKITIFACVFCTISAWAETTTCDINYTPVTGNSWQNGTPTPENPVEVISLGDRTANLFDSNIFLGVTGWQKNGDEYFGDMRELFNKYHKDGMVSFNGKPNTQYTFSYNIKMDGTIYGGRARIIYSDNSYTDLTAYSSVDKPNYKKVTGTSENGKTIVGIKFPYTEGTGNAYFKEFIIEEGSTATPYVPYGYQISVVATGTSGDPTTTPIYLNAPLRKVGNYADVLDYKNGTITRNVGAKVLDGTNLNIVALAPNYGVGCTHQDLGALPYAQGGNYNAFICSHLKVGPVDNNDTLVITSATYGIRFIFNSSIIPDGATSEEKVSYAKSYLAQQYAAGTPVIVYYPLATPVVEQIENWSCTPPITDIQIATTKFVDEEFKAAEDQLATTVQTIESVVSRTIAQTGQIATLQAEKQTRPDENCPANMKCLLVQDEDGTPHWYPIIEP